MNIFKVFAMFIQRQVGLIFFLFSFSLYSFEEIELHNTIKSWEKENANNAIVLITSPLSGKIEYTYDEDSAFFKKLPLGSVMKTLSSFLFLAYPEKFQFSSNEKYFCNGKFEEPYANFFKKIDKKKFHLIEGKKLDKTYFSCSRVNGHREITLENALASSCNSYYLHFASRKPEFFNRRLVSDWKLNEGTGAEFENKRIPENYNYRNKSNFTKVLSSIGDSGEFTVTALKIAQIYGAIVAGTEILKPIRLGELPEVHNPFPYSEKLRKEVQKSLELTVKEGTLKSLKHINSSVKILAGKTGTPTQRGRKILTHGWNIIFFEKADNVYLLVVFTENGIATRETIELSKKILNSI